VYHACGHDDASSVRETLFTNLLKTDRHYVGDSSAYGRGLKIAMASERASTIQKRARIKP
jgi:hypothetical protein